MDKEKEEKTNQRNRRKVIRLTEEDFEKLLSGTVNRIVNESRMDNQLRIAQKELYSASKNLGSVGMRLEGTRFQEQFMRAWNEVKKLNELLIGEIRNNNEKLNG